MDEIENCSDCKWWHEVYVKIHILADHEGLNIGEIMSHAETGIYHGHGSVIGICYIDDASNGPETGFDDSCRRFKKSSIPRRSLYENKI